MSLIVHQQQPAPGGAGKPSGRTKRAASALVSQLSWAVAGPAILSGSSYSTPSASSSTSGGGLARLLPDRKKHRQPAPSSQPAAKAIRALAKVKSATHYCVLGTEDGVFAGLYLPSPIQKQGGKALHSLGLVFLAMLQALAREQLIEGVNGILCLSSTVSASQMAFVVIEDGHITVDAIYDPALASETIASKLVANSMPVFVDLQTVHDTPHDVRPLDWDDLYAYTSAQTQLVKIPPSPLTIFTVVLIALLVVSAGAGYGYQQTVIKPREQTALRLKAAQSDPTPAYSVAFASQANKAGWDKSDVSNRLSILRAQPVFLAGWSLQAIECAIDNKVIDANAANTGGVQGGVCSYAWKRAGGTLTEFRAAIDQARTPIDMAVSGVSTLVTNEQVSVRLAALDTNTLKTTAASQEAYWPFAQRLGNIKDASVSVGETKRWDGFDTIGVSNGALVNTTPITINCPMYLVSDVLDQMPSEVFLRSFSINTQTATVQLKGVIYAR